MCLYKWGYQSITGHPAAFCGNFCQLFLKDWGKRHVCLFRCLKIILDIQETQLSNSYTMACPPVRGDNPRALASGISYAQVVNTV